MAGDCLATSADGNWVIESALPTPPPGFAVEKTFGAAFAADFDRMKLFDSPDIYKMTAKTSAKLVETAKRAGGNAILAETLSLQAPVDGGWFNVYCVVTGEVVLLRRLEQ